jgi:hypothetical protein
MVRPQDVAVRRVLTGRNAYAPATTSGQIAASTQPLVKHLTQPDIKHAPRKGDDTSN